MSIKKYTAERNVQIVIGLLKQNNIRKVVASPGATNVSIVASMQSDPFFEMYSVVDERSAAYFACGLSQESNEPVVLSCTGATSSRDYMPGLTEAFYSKLPILAITSSISTSSVGHLFAQSTDRSAPPKDVAVNSFLLQEVKDADDEWNCMIKMNKAISFLSINGGGPVHINLITQFSMDFSVEQIPVVRNIKRIDADDTFPSFPKGRVAIFIGSFHKWTPQLLEKVDAFCATHNAVVLCDQTSGYQGKYRMLSALYAAQEKYNHDLLEIDLLIHIGEISGDYYTIQALRPKEVWRVNEDGEIRDRFQSLTYVFKMKCTIFFEYYSKDCIAKDDSFIKAFKEKNDLIRSQIPELPFSNIWIASQTAPHIPKNSCVHLGILQSLRSWNFFEADPSVKFHSNVGGFGIDGNFSTLVGASLVNPNKLYFGIVGDLSFFYDLNIIGNRHLSNNIRLLVINNGKGMEFRTYKHRASIFGEDTDKYIAAANHNGRQSKDLLKHMAQDLGFHYLTADSKMSFENVFQNFVTPTLGTAPTIFEVFTDTDDEVESLKLLQNTIVDNSITAKQKMKSIIGPQAISMIKKMLK